jgi:hypothetical protein
VGRQIAIVGEAVTSYLVIDPLTWQRIIIPLAVLVAGLIATFWLRAMSFSALEKRTVGNPDRAGPCCCAA